MSSGGDDLPHEEHEEHANHESWVIPYADLLTLLMAMFIALFAISSVNVDKAKRMSAGFNQSISGNPLTGLISGSPSASPVAGSGSASNSGQTDSGPTTNPSGTQILKQLLENKASVDEAKNLEQKSLKNVEKQIKAAAAKVGLGDKLSFDLQGRGLVIRIVSDKVLFAPASAAIQLEGQQVLRLVGEVLRPLPNTLLIEGHTDDRVISTSVYPSNWELSTARAGSVVRFLVDALHMNPEQMQPTGRAALDPIGDNTTAEGRAKNRRVDIIVESQVIDQLLRQQHLTNATDSSGTASIDPNLQTVVGNLANIANG